MATHLDCKLSPLIITGTVYLYFICIIHRKMIMHIKSQESSKINIHIFYYLINRHIRLRRTRNFFLNHTCSKFIWLFNKDLSKDNWGKMRSTSEFVSANWCCYLQLHRNPKVNYSLEKLFSWKQLCDCCTFIWVPGRL